MDEWLDEEREKSVPPLLESGEDIPVPIVSGAIDVDILQPWV